MSMKVTNIRTPNIGTMGIRTYGINGGALKGGHPAPPPEPQPTILSAWRMLGNSIVVGDDSSNINLPDGYQLCEYIESNGKQVISLGYNTKYRYEIMCGNTKISSTAAMLLGNGGAATQYFGFQNGKATLGGGIDFASTDIINQIDVTFENEVITATVDGETKSRTGTSVSTNYYLFCFNNSIGRYNASVKLYSLKAFDVKSDELVHDWIPCLDASGIACLYDAMGNKAYYCSNLDDAKPFDYKLAESKQILSCGDLGADGKFHILVNNGKDVTDIALDQPLRKVDAVADILEYNGNGTLTQNVGVNDDGSLYALATPIVTHPSVPQIGIGNSYTCDNEVTWSEFTHTP